MFSRSARTTLLAGERLRGGEERGGILTFCQFFLSSETRKLTESCTFWKICFSSMSTLPTATPMHSTFFSWNFTRLFVSSTCFHFLKRDKEDSKAGQAMSKRPKH